MLIDEAWTLWLGLVDLLSSRSSSHNNVAFIDFHTTVQTSCVERTLVRVFDTGEFIQRWKLVPTFLRGAVLLQYCSKPCPLSPLLFNLLVNGLAGAVQRSAPGAQFFLGGVRLPVKEWCFLPTLC